MMNGRDVKVEGAHVRVRCRKCDVVGDVLVNVVTTDHGLTLLRGNCAIYCRCGGGERTEIDMLISTDPEMQPVARIRALADEVK